jgi:hypothetical protein
MLAEYLEIRLPSYRYKPVSLECKLPWSFGRSDIPCLSGHAVDGASHLYCSVWRAWFPYPKVIDVLGAVVVVMLDLSAQRHLNDLSGSFFLGALR